MRVFCSTLVLLLFFPAISQAAYMDCMEKSKGKKLVWDSGWESDNSDNGTHYEITDVSIYNRLPDRSVTLTLRAIGNHSKKRRVFKVTTEEKARAFCERLVREERKLSLPHVTDSTDQASESLNSELSALPFIRFSTDGWVRDNPPRGAALEVCRVLKERFSCLRDEKNRYGSSLTELEAQLRWRIRDR
jgi:hypothetical protein